MNKKKLGIYIHIPFCAKKCAYCNFASFKTNEEEQKNYFLKLENETLKRLSDFSKTYIADTIYFGGGTPSFVSVKYLQSILSAIDRNIDISLNCEKTIECNPDDITPDKAGEIAEYGFNRVSLGLQTADDNILKLIGRRHNYEAFEQAVSLFRKNNINNLSVDLMLGLPEQTLKTVEETLAKITGINGIKHFSVYGLKTEQGTALENYEPDADLTADMYDKVLSEFSKRNINRYEISNFCYTGFESRHNLKYWNYDDYLGLGLGAHSFYSDTRYANPDNFQDYYSGKFTEETIPKDERKKEYIMLRLRTTEGISVERYKLLFGCSIVDDYSSVLEKLKKNNLITVDNASIKIKPECFYVSNSIISEFF